MTLIYNPRCVYKVEPEHDNRKASSRRTIYDNSGI